MHGICTRCEVCPIRHRSVCGSLADEELAALSKVARKRLCGPNQTIFADGDEAKYYFCMVRGIVKLVKTFTTGEQHIIGLVYPPELLGEPLNPHHSYSAEAATEVELCCFPRAPFDALLKSNPNFKQALLEATLQELKICRNWSLLLARKSAYEKVASFLYMLASRILVAGCAPSPAQVHVRLPFTRAEIADYLGLTLETVSRQLSHLKSKKVIELPTSRDVVIPDLNALATIGHIESCAAGENKMKHDAS